MKYLFLQILQNSQENTSARVSFLKDLQANGCNFIKKKRLCRRCFPVKFYEKIPSFYRTRAVAASAVVS